MRWEGEVMSDRVAACALKVCLIVFCGFVIAFGQSSQPDNAAKCDALKQ
jgi:hypothetical protein